MKKTLYILFAIALLISCRDNGAYRTLQSAEQLLETDVVAADSILESMAPPSSKRGQAWFAVLKTQADYKQYKPITSDSLILTATNYYGSHRKSYRSAMAWYSQGCVYSELQNDLAAIDAFLKSKDLFPDTLIRYYALAEQKLGTFYLNRVMLEQSKKQFECCKSNAERLNDQKMFHYTCVRLGLCSLYGKDFETSDSIFSEILNNDSFTDSHKALAKLQKAKINLYYNKIYVEALSYVDSYIYEMIQHLSNPGTGYSVKADIFYEMKEYDSAYFYYNESMKYDNELYTKCSNADRLTELSVLSGFPFDAIEWHKLYGELRDSINEIERTREIEEIQYQHKELITEEKYAHKQRILVLIGSSVLLMVILILIIIYSTYRHKENERIMKKQQDLIKMEEEIRKSTIIILESKIRDFSAHDPSARSTLLKSYSNRLKMCTMSFSSTPEYKLLSIVKYKIRKLNNDETYTLLSQIKISFLDSINDFQTESSNINEEIILTYILKYLGLTNEQISHLFYITEDSVKKRLYRLSQKMPSDFINLYTV